MEEINENPMTDESQALVVDPTTDIRYAVIDGQNVVNVIMWDGSETPNETSATPFRDSFGQSILVELPHGSQVGPGWTYVGGQFVAPPVAPPPPMTAGEAQAMKTNLIAHASVMIAPLQDMVDLGEATPEEEAALLAWKRYRIALTRITSTTTGWPASIVWPEMPA